MATETLTTMTVEQPLDGVLVATLNRPDRLNAMTNQMFDELEHLALAHQRSDLRVLIMTGAGRAFCAGFDLDDAEAVIAAVPDEALDVLGVACRPGELAEQVERHAVGYDHLALVPPPWGLTSEETEVATEVLIDEMAPALVGVRS